MNHQNITGSNCIYFSLIFSSTRMARAKCIDVLYPKKTAIDIIFYED